ncbi:unnamed protein product [Chrysoparadoxa australica]
MASPPPGVPLPPGCPPPGAAGIGGLQGTPPPGVVLSEGGLPPECLGGVEIPSFSLPYSLEEEVKYVAGHVVPVVGCLILAVIFYFRKRQSIIVRDVWLLLLSGVGLLGSVATLLLGLSTSYVKETLPDLAAIQIAT